MTRARQAPADWWKRMTRQQFRRYRLLAHGETDHQGESARFGCANRTSAAARVRLGTRLFRPSQLTHATFTPRSRSDNLVQVRTYDCMITYDKYYQTPRMWLLGYDEVRTLLCRTGWASSPVLCTRPRPEKSTRCAQQKRPLPPASALDDVSADHAQKTVTIEPFPHSSSLSIASVHPCKHSSVMKKVIERMDGNVRELQRRERKSREGGGGGAGTPSSEGEKKKGSGSSGGGKWLGLGRKKDSATSTSETGTTSPTDEEEGLRVEQYLLVFLKFMSTISTPPFSPVECCTVTQQYFCSPCRRHLRRPVVQRLRSRWTRRLVS